MAPQDVDDQAADDRRGDQCGGKLLEEKTDLLGVDLLEMSVCIQCAAVGAKQLDPPLPRARASRPRRLVNRQRLITTHSLNGGGVRGP